MQRSIPGASVDPHAPGDHPNHPSQIGKAPAGRTQADDDERAERLILRYATAAERSADQVPDRAELEARESIVLKAYDEDDPAPVTITDATGVDFAWIMRDDEEPDGWEPIPPEETPAPPAEEPESKPRRRSKRAKTRAELDAALEALRAIEQDQA